MTKDFSKYQKIIDQFRGKVSNNDFESRFATLTQGMPKPEKFILKMELKRLASPCARLIDLRGHVDGECRLFEHEGRQHFLDDIAIRAFNDNLRDYGSYTFGVYEAVKNTENNFRVIYQSEKSRNQVEQPSSEDKKTFEKLQYPATLYQFGQYYDRIEERMNFAIALIITLADGQEVEAVSSDISVNGCKCRLSEVLAIAVGQKITIRFVGLEQEFQLGDKNTFDYKVCNIHGDELNQLIGVKRIASQEKDSFKTFLDGFIQGNKRRYKINLDNTIAALQVRSLEQFILPQANELPIFIEKSSAGFTPRYALTSSNNRKVFQYWQDEKRSSTLSYLLNEERLAFLQQDKRSQPSLLVYSFIHVSKGQTYFYTADERQLKSNKVVMKQFLGFAASKASFAISELSLIKLDIQRAHSPFTLSDSCSKVDAYLQRPPGKEVLESLTALPYLMVVRDITEPVAVAEYKQLLLDDVNTQLIKPFGHKRLAKALMIDELGINYKNHRQEPRFKYKTPVVMEIKGMKWQGVSHDFSVSGLKVELANRAVLGKGDVVSLTFPALQKITSAFDLKALPYEVMHVDEKKTIINCRVFVKQHQHIGRKFFALLISKNKEKLAADEYTSLNPELAKALRTLYANSLTEQSLVIQSSGSRYKIEAIASSGKYGNLLPQMHHLSDRPQYYNLYPLLNNLQATNSLNTRLKQMLVTDKPETVVLYISINNDAKMVDQAVTTKLASELSSVKLRKLFIANALKRGSFFCIQTKLSRTEEPDMDHLNPELSYIGAYAIHKGKQIEQEIWSVAGVLQLFDVTKDTMIRYQLVPTIAHEKFEVTDK